MKPRPKREREKVHSVIDVTLDAVQRRLVELPPTGALLVLGEAGYGKTTVALWRLAHLYRASIEKKRRSPNARFRAAVIVPTEGLRRLLQAMLVKLGVDVLVHVYEKFAARQARRVFADIPRRESDDASAGTIRIKRERALTKAIGVLAARPRAEFDEDDDRPQISLETHASCADLLHLFGDRVLMDRVAHDAAIALHAVEEILEHTHVQFSRTTEQASRHVDKKRLVAVDKLAIDRGTAMNDACSIDSEDYAALFEIDRRRALRLNEPPSAPRLYDCIVVDEAQELAPLELALIGRSLERDGTLIVAGDADQQVDASASFIDWPTTMRDLFCDSFETATLEVGYRCPPAVTQFARAVLAAEKSADLQTIPTMEFSTEEALVAALDAALVKLQEADANISVAIIARTTLTARRIAQRLTEAPRRVVLDGSFNASSGIVVTTVEQVKGLEFDTVIVPDASYAEYPDTPASRRALYVAATRARHQLVIMSAEKMSPIVKAKDS
ncbi:MAG: ATP-binding domain-containing protein [Polyangiaceae bacterium]